MPDQPLLQVVQDEGMIDKLKGKVKARSSPASHLVLRIETVRALSATGASLPYR